MNMNLSFLSAAQNWEKFCPAVLMSETMPKGVIQQHICSLHTFALKFMSTSVAQHC